MIDLHNREYCPVLEKLSDWKQFCVSVPLS